MKKSYLVQILVLTMMVLFCSGCSQDAPKPSEPVSVGDAGVADEPKAEEELLPGEDAATVALVNLLSAEPLVVSDELIEAFYYYLPFETELNFLPEFGGGQAVNWDELSLFIFEEYQALFPEPGLERELTQGEFKEMAERLLKDVTYTDQSSLYLTYEDNKYICGNFSMSGGTDYRLTKIEKDEQGVYSATFDRLLFSEGETFDFETSKNVKAIYDSVGATEPLQNHDFQPALVNILIQDNYAEILDMSGDITITFTLSGDPIYPFRYHSCVRTLYEVQ